MKSNNPVVSSIIKNYNTSQKAFLPKIVNIPLSQESESCYKAIVKPGDMVKEGDVIAQSEFSKGWTSSLHSSVPGKILSIDPCVSPNGHQEFAVKIKFGGALSYLGKIPHEKTPDSYTQKEIATTLIKNGVINTFKTAIPENLGIQIEQINAIQERHNLVVRLFDEDPYRITDSLMYKFYFAEIVKGARFIAKAINAKGIIFAIDTKSHEKNYFDNPDYKDIYALEMKIQRYPCGTPREIVSAFVRGPLNKICNFTLTKRDLFTDSSTIYEAYKALALSTPCVDRMVHFSGNCLNASCLLDVKLGTSIRDIVPQIGGFTKEPAHIIINGMLCGYSVKSLDIPITKYVKSVEFLSKKKNTDEQIYTCINCGNCRFACPVKLSPDILYNHTVNFKLLKDTYAASALACIECGLCNTVCPARLPLCQTIKVLKNKITE
ncbi:4Fe-4S dicluster domain-containing protein [Treponema bryantii]|uniref:4Fe-4S dicluster domain-containing protein n=1 Tax=Treponema bryantii TaxID=163 RepID=UPI0003B4A907|nr:4Fe-4S dicluster domain-containing protein [Treponema bryantii]